MKYRKGRDRDSNGDKSEKGGGGGASPPSIKLDIVRGVSASFSRPWTPTPGTGSGSVRSSRGRSSSDDGPPEKQLTLLALRVAVLEKAASGLGKLDFVWATVVLLGGFVGSLSLTDFWCITVILVGEALRVFSRSHELEWEHHATETSTAAAAAVKKNRTGHAPNGVSLLPLPCGAGELFTTPRNIGRSLYWMQVIWALACVVLSLMRLWNHEFGGGSGAAAAAGGGGNMRPALLLFYTLALLEALLFLLEKAYWAFSFRKLLDHVNERCELGTCGDESLTRFFYDAYSRCVTGSIFDGIKMDLVTYAEEELILSDFLEEQLIGVRILERFAAGKVGSSASAAGDTLRKVGTSARSVERLVEMLGWKRRDEAEVRRSAAEVVCGLAGRRQNALRLSAIPGAIESVASLLHTGRGRSAAAGDGHGEGRDGDDDYDHLPFNLLGLRILEELAKDHDNCGKISNARGLLAKIIDFTRAPQHNQHASDSEVSAVKLALQLVKRLVSTTGNTGKAVRQGVAENVFAVSNLRGILTLQQLQRHGELQKLAVDVLTWLAMDDGGKEAIMGTGGLVKILLSVFVGAEGRHEHELGHGAGDALAMLALESETGCAAILKRADVLQLVSALQGGDGDDDDDRRRLYVARVLRSLCAYAGPEHVERLRAVTTALPVALGATMTKSGKVLEACVGLTTQICRFVDGERFAAALRAAGVEERERGYVQRLAAILRENEYPEVRIPRMRRFVVQQVIWLMTCSGGGGGGLYYMELLRGVGMERLLESIADTTSELENYHVFSGSVGVGEHRESFPGIVDSALELIKGGGGRAAAEK